LLVYILTQHPVQLQALTLFRSKFTLFISIFRSKYAIPPGNSRSWLALTFLLARVRRIRPYGQFRGAQTSLLRGDITQIGCNQENQPPCVVPPSIDRHRLSLVPIASYFCLSDTPTIFTNLYTSKYRKTCSISTVEGGYRGSSPNFESALWRLYWWG